MTAQLVSFNVEESDLALLQELADAFSGGDRNEFLRMAMKVFKENLHFKQMEALRAEALAERGGEVFTTEETLEFEDVLIERTVRLDIHEVARRLNAALGATLVSALAGAKDAKSSHEWAKEGGPQLRPETVRRLVFAYEQWRRVAEAEGEQIARAWFIGANPRLDDDTPVSAIREDRLKDVARAAKALVEDSFSG